MKPSAELALPKLKLEKRLVGKSAGRTSFRVEILVTGAYERCSSAEKMKANPEHTLFLVRGVKMRIKIAPRTKELRTSAASHLQTAQGGLCSRTSLAGEALWGVAALGG